ncbi:adenosylcobinamide-GDP ribazoletransferase [Roseovarius faecimaris]|uniref:Adenosylcobinamide-GDP ribazoletransferase n=1 Tax=Roseovarius faecimaris TaxID=2494550 RepID=A0A6I6IQK3_9RHOB|nr:adenosylcobinamide-GDP ribazoletransferase [Roseovarius faecimaris]QGX98975.1 adenosylcobinamide-GDP ribazoletransferase [Roseovarius faecimaris]
MPDDKITPALIRASDPVTALSLLTRLPLPARQTTRAAEAAWAYPLAGLVVAGLAALVGLAALGLGLPAPLVAMLVLGAQVMLTGAMHEDGLADMADGLWGGWDKAARLEIMRDSRIGTYGVIALCLGLASRWAALWLLFDAGAGPATAALLAGSALSRAGMPVLMAALPHARSDGLSHLVGGVPPRSAALGTGIAVACALALLGAAALTATLCAAIVLAGLAALARQKIGGQTGDILGASQQLTEIAVLFTCTALLT